MLVVPLDGSRATADRLAADAGGSVVGQIPSLDLYQLEVPTTTMAGLEALLSSTRADPAVDLAIPNYVGEYDRCPAERDVGELDPPDRCPWEDNRYLPTATVLQELDREIPRYPVHVAVVDSGLALGSREFDEVSVADVSQPGGHTGSLADTVGHGTMVASLIAADDDGFGIDGIASPLRHDLHLLVSTIQSVAIAEVLGATQRALDAGAQVVNWSLGYGPYAETIPTGYTMAEVQLKFDGLIRDNPQALFVAAAGNEPEELTGLNRAPAGLDHPNLITVGSSEPCAPERHVEEHFRGARIDIVAQGRDVQAIAPNGDLVRGTGTSFSTPQVSAAAALLFSIQPELTPHAVRSALLEHALPGPPTAGGRFLNVARPVHQLLLDEQPDLAPVLDGDDDGEADAAGILAARVCSASQYTIDGIGSYQYTRDEESDVVAVGAIAEDGLTLSLLRPGSDLLALACEEGCAFELGTWPATGSFVSPPDPGGRMPPIGQLTGELDASWTLTDCVIEERVGDPVPGLSDSMRDAWPDRGIPQHVRITSSASGTFTGGRVDGYDRDGEPIVSELTRPFSGELSVLFVNGVPDREHPIVQALETHCENGRLR